MKITYIYHSCFVVELNSVQLIFDYYKGKLNKLSPNKPVYFFASHKHQDHFTMELFRLLNDSYSKKYILGSDIRLNAKYLERNGYKASILEDIYRVKKYDEIVMDGMLKIRTIESTDMGVAFIIEAEGKKIYHAGDLNPWCFDLNTEEENNLQIDRYLKQIEKIKDEHFDIAFLPLDYRLGKFSHLGIDYFMKMTDCDHVFPMHMWRHYKLCDKCLQSSLAEYKDRFIKISGENEEWVF